MSFDKNFQNLNLKSVSKNSDSFEDRFCDDLCEDILQYLSLEDKLRLECVSKQFQRTVFVKQFTITLKAYTYPESYAKCKQVFDLNYLKSIESVLKKCSNIRKFDSSIHTNYEMRRNIIQLITKYCNQLNEFNGYLIDSNEEEFKEFHRKFGSKLKRLYFRRSEEYNLFSNSESIEKNVFILPEECLRIDLNKLKKVNLFITRENKYFLAEVLKKFNKITHLNISFYSNALSSSLKEIPLLQNLIHFRIYSFFVQKDKEFYDSLNLLANKCPKLKRLEFDFYIEYTNILELKQQLNPLKAFHSLKRLDINLPILSVKSNIYEFSFKAFEGLSNITHLGLKFNGNHVNESVLKDIDNYLPKLQYLEIKSRFTTHLRGMTQMVEILSRLSRLQTIKLRFKHEVDYQPMKAMIIEKCLKIKTIKLSS